MPTDQPFDRFDAEAMATAVQLARNGWYSARPNPRVGCVISRGRRIIGSGWHHRAGEAHAEVNALRQAGSAASGATAYVTLEPCNHQGRTGPCAVALVQAGIVEVVYGMEDPHAVAAGGLETLRRAGVRVRGPLMEQACRDLNPGFIRRCQSGRPRVRVKLAMSLDGRTAMASGESNWITGIDARADVQRLRAESDALLTGIGTVLADDPQMNVRPGELRLPDATAMASLQPLRVVVDSSLRLPRDARLLTSGGAVLVVTAGSRGSIPGAEVLALGRESGTGVDLGLLLRELAARHCNDVLVEAGPTLAGALIGAGLVDELIVYMAPKLLGSSARPLLQLPLERLAQAPILSIRDMRAVGRDWRITATVEKI